MKHFCISENNRFQLRKPYNLVLYLIPFNVTYDFFSLFYAGSLGPLSFLRAIILITVILALSGGLLKDSLTHAVILFIFYVLLLIPLSSNIVYSAQVSVKIFITLLMLPIGYSLIRTKSSLDQLNKTIFIIYLILVTGFIAYNIFDVGGSVYVDVGFSTGGMSDSWNTITYPLLLAPLFFYTKNNKLNYYLFFFLFIFLSIILLISFKRIAIAGFIFGFLIYFYNQGQLKKFFKYSFYFIAALALFFPVYSDAIKLKYEARKQKLNIEYLQNEEGRSLETRIVFDEIFGFKNITKSLIGGEAFNSVGQYAGGQFGKRQAHVDYNLILISNGIVGLILYFNIYLQVFKKYSYIKRYTNPLLMKKNSVYVSVFFSLILTSLLTSMAGQMYEITFRSIIFLYVGAILGYLSNLEYFARSEKGK